MFNIPGILNPKTPANAEQRIVTDARGGFEVVLTNLEPQTTGFPKIEVIISYDNGVEVERILHDKVGLLVQRRLLDNGLQQFVWSNSAESVHGFLLARGSYTLQAFVNGQLVTSRIIVSQSDPAREDWQDYKFANNLYILEEYDDLCVAQ